jgi:hypothetical protein
MFAWGLDSIGDSLSHIKSFFTFLSVIFLNDSALVEQATFVGTAGNRASVE